MLLNDRLELVGSVVKVGGKVGGGSSVVEGVSGSVKLLGRVGRQLGCLLVVS